MLNTIVSQYLIEQTRVGPPFVADSWCDGAPSLDRGEGDDDDAFASFAFQFQALAPNLRDELAAFTAGFVMIACGRRLRFCQGHRAGCSK